jgi:hypothetical protein
MAGLLNSLWMASNTVCSLVDSFVQDVRLPSRDEPM